MSCCFLMFAAGCSPDTTDTSTTVATDTSTTVTTDTSTGVATEEGSGTLTVHSATITVNESEVAVGATKGIQPGDRVQATDVGRASLQLQQNQLALEAFKGSNFGVPDTTKDPITVPLMGGHLLVRVPLGTAPVQLETADRTLAALSDGTSFVACQSPQGITCLYVIAGSVGWSDPRGSATYVAGEGTFAPAGAGPGAARCDVDDTLERWLAQSLDGEETETGTLTATVDTLPEGRCGGEALASADGMAHVVIAEPVIGTEDFETRPEGYREPAQIDGPIEFHVDEQAVTNADFRKWVVDVAKNDPEDWKRLVPQAWLVGVEGVEPQATYPAGEDESAVVGIRWGTAQDYCRSVQKRLVTEIEWELAAVNGHLLDLQDERRDWVAVPGEYGDEPPEGERIVRGNDNTFLLDLYYRLPALDTAESTATGRGARIRCAADEVGETEVISGLPTEEFADDFAFDGSGWPEDEDELFSLAYHGPDVYHLQSSQPHTRGAVIRDTSGSSERIHVRSTIFIERSRMSEPEGEYRFGITVGSADTGFLLFTVQPDEVTDDRHDWCLSMMSDQLTAMLGDENHAWYLPSTSAGRHDGESCANGISSGSFQVANIDAPLIMTILVSTDDVVVALNDRELETVGLAIPFDAYGFYVQTYHEDLAHIHYDDILVTVP